MNTVELFESIQSASLSTLYTYKAKIARMESESEMPESLSILFEKSIRTREAQLVRVAELTGQIQTLTQSIIEAKNKGEITEGDSLTLRHMMKSL